MFLIYHIHLYSIFLMSYPLWFFYCCYTHITYSYYSYYCFMFLCILLYYCYFLQLYIQLSRRIIFFFVWHKKVNFDMLKRCLNRILETYSLQNIFVYMQGCFAICLFCFFWVYVLKLWYFFSGFFDQQQVNQKCFEKSYWPQKVIKKNKIFCVNQQSWEGPVQNYVILPRIWEWLDIRKGFGFIYNLNWSMVHLRDRWR